MRPTRSGVGIAAWSVVTPTEQMLTAALGVTWGGLGLSFAIGKWARSRETDGEIPLYRITQLEHRMDQAGEKMSDFTNMIQAMPDKLRLEFVTRLEWNATERRRREKDE